MIKKLLRAGVILGAAVAAVTGMSAFEAHVINVQARIENALEVSPLEINFGTVFPQEYLTYNFDVKLSKSFLDEDRVDDVEYVIKQKAKPRPEEPKVTGDAQVESNVLYCHNHTPLDPDDTGLVGDPGDPENPYYDRCYPDLGPYLSKHKDPAEEEKDTELDAFHDPRVAVANGRLSKKENDVHDRWIIDLATPCFGVLGASCAQDWPVFYDAHNGNVTGAGDAWEWTLDPRMEHEVFGADLWIEVTGISVNHIDRVDIGTESSETLHSAEGFGPIEPDTHGGTWGGIASDSASPDNKTRVVYASSANGDGTDEASFMLDFGMGGNVKLVFRLLDGSQDDNFEFYIDGVHVAGSGYDGQGGGEEWILHEVPVEGRLTSLHKITVKAACDPNICSVANWWNTWGHAAIDYVMVVEDPTS